MSTRCQIEFKHVRKYLGSKEVVDRRTIYRHSDGYPEGVIPDLKRFLSWNAERNNDIEYQTANFIYWSKRQYEDDYFNKEEKKKVHWFDNANDQLGCGFGVCANDELHGDIEYYYEVVREVRESTKNKFSTKTSIFVYEVKQKDYSKPVTRKHLQLKQTVIIKEVKA